MGFGTDGVAAAIHATVANMGFGIRDGTGGIVTLGFGTSGALGSGSRHRVIGGGWGQRIIGM